MKKNPVRNILALIALLFVISALVSEHVSLQSSRDSSAMDSFQKVLWNKEKIADECLWGVMSTFDPKDGFKDENPDYEYYIKTLKKNGIIFISYQRDSLFVWTDNSVEIPNVYDSLKFTPQLNKLGHAWYLVKQIEKDSRNVIALISIRNAYPYQNSYLRNEFQKDFGDTSSITMVIDSTRGYPVVDSNGNYLFSLERVSDDFSREGGLNLVTLLFLLGLIVFLLFGVVFIGDIINVGLRRWSVIIFGFLLWGIREVMLRWGIPVSFYSQELFSPILYAASNHFPSLGDYILNSLFVFVWVFTFFKNYDLSNLFRPGSKTGFYLTFSGVLAGAFILFYLVVGWFESLIIDSSISFRMFQFSDITIYTFWGYLGIVLLFYALMLICDTLVGLCHKNCSLGHYSLIVIVGGIMLWVFGVLLIPNLKFIDIVFLIILLLVYGVIIYRGDPGFRYSLFIVLLIGVSVFLVYCINDFSQQKEREGLTVAAMNLATEYDPASEALLLDLNDSLVNDTRIKDWCKDPFVNEEAITAYIKEQYFSGYWDQFEVQVTLCHYNDDLRVEPNGQIQNCFEFFSSMIEESGEKIPQTRFYYLNTFDGLVSYLGVLEFSSSRFDEVNIYIRIDSRRSDEGLGYPSLLLDDKFNRKPVSRRYSYAKYLDGRLIVSSGSFNYYLNSEPLSGGAGECTWVEKDGYNHLVYRFGDNNSVVVSTPMLNLYNQLITFPYIFVFFYLFALLIWFIQKFPWKLPGRFNFKYRIQYSLVGVLMLFFIVLGGGNVFYSINQFKAKHNKQLGDKLQLVKRELFEGVYSVDDLDQNQNPFLIDRLRRFSNVISADINLYNLNGNLIATSRPEIYDKGLMGRNMNYGAYSQLFYQKRTQYIHQENMGRLEYLSAYETIVDDRNETIAYLNLPYFMRNQELQQELFNLVVAGINLHLFMILLAIFLSVFISNKITYPLKLIQDRFKQTRLGATNEKIDYPKRDEIGSLVEEYNRMVDELEESAQMLARSERESAWREMARQIAHEIKNPLTPMKLSIQFLEKSWDDKVPDWDKYLKRVSSTLIEQIDNLSAIATAFSGFAKMPLANNERLNLVEILKHVVHLYRNDRFDIKLELHKMETAWVFVDREQFVRVYVNLINNAIQSIPEDRKGFICLELRKEEGEIITVVQDNGTGISPELRQKLFVPNFTTKSGGMGLGLAIVKNIVENAGGSIWVESQPGIGSSFFIRLPEIIEE